jgi:putative colanic acid biosynthesis UDP-glucose lipid carrier transferase
MLQCKISLVLPEKIGIFFKREDTCEANNMFRQTVNSGAWYRPKTDEVVAGRDASSLRLRPRSPSYVVLKRLLDLAGSALLILILSPALLLIAFLIRRHDGGPVFFLQERHGLNGKIFRIIKFRTMTATASTDAFKQCRPGDERVTEIGRLLRRTSLDELPQLFNVVMGDMSLVGPRPHAVEHDLEACGMLEGYWQRYTVLPGMTGLAQIRGQRGETADLKLMMSRVKSDLEYVTRASLLLDLAILFGTTVVVSTGKNAH